MPHNLSALDAGTLRDYSDRCADPCYEHGEDG